MKNDKVLAEARERFALCVDAESEQRTRMEDALKFEAGDQWPESIKRIREQDPTGPRPCLVINHARVHAAKITNDLRQQRPQMKALPVDDKADPETADMLNGLFRHIQVASDADIAYDVAAESMVRGGLGYYRIVPEVVDEETNEQEIKILPVWNVFSAYMDPFIEHPAGADAMYAFVTEDEQRDKFKRKYPKAELVDWEEAGKDESLRLWYPESDIIRVAEYWHVEEETRNTIYTDDREYAEDDYWNEYKDVEARPKVTGTRERKERVVYWCRLSGNEVLEKTVFPSRFVGLIRVPGEERIINGKRVINGIIQPMMDAARMYNYWASLNTERIALSPKPKWLTPARAIEGHEARWQRANLSNDAYLSYNDIDSQGNPVNQPSRIDPVQQDTAIIQALIQAADDMRSASGMHEASFGDQGNEKSGIAIRERQRMADVATYHFADNFTRSMRHAGRVVLDMIPQIYDTRRVARILGEDESPDFAIIDPTAPRAFTQQEDINGRITRIYNPSIGRYDVVMATGPTYATKRIEAFESMSQILTGNPELWGVIGDLLVKSMDWPGADEMAERMKALLPPEVKAIADAKEAGKQGAQAEMQAMQQAMMAQIAPMVQQLEMSLQEAGMAVEERDAAIADLQKQLEDKAAEIQAKLAEAQIKAQAEIRKAEIESQSEVAVAYLSSEQEGEEQEKPEDSTGAVANITAAQASQQAVQMMGQLAQSLAEQVQSIAQAAQQAAQVAQAAMESQGQVTQGLSSLEQRMSQAEQRREFVTNAVIDYLKSDQSDKALQKAVKTLQ